MSAHSLAYRERLCSADWSAIRRDRIIENRWRCEECGYLSYDLDLHHETYDRLGQERRQDLRLLCKVCHRRADTARRRRVEARAWSARVDGWATKVYGDDWAQDYSSIDMDERFSDWLAIGGEGEGKALR